MTSCANGNSTAGFSLPGINDPRRRLVPPLGGLHKMLSLG